MKLFHIFILIIISFSVRVYAISTHQSVVQYFVDYSYYEEYSAELLGVYAINDDVPQQILEDTYRMSQILSHYLFLSKNPNFNNNNEIGKLSEDFSEILSEDLFKKFAQKHYNNQSEIRDIGLILHSCNRKLTLQNIRIAHNKVSNYNQKKKDFFSRQNNDDGVNFCYDIENTTLKQLKVIENKYKGMILSTEDILESDIRTLSKKDLKIAWNYFKENDLSLIQAYFDSKAEQLYVLDKNLLNIKYDSNGSKKAKHYFICLNIYGQNWYLELYDDYPSDSHKVKFIKL